MSEETKEKINNLTASVLEWRLAAFWFILFSVNSLCTAITAALVGADWATMDAQARFMVCVAVVLNWTGTIMAFVSKNATKISQGKPFDEDLTAITKTDKIS